MPSESAGPLTIPDSLTRTLHALAAAAGTNDFVPLSVAAMVLAGRLARRVRFVRGPREALSPGRVDPAESFRAALDWIGELRVAPSPEAAADRQVDATIIVSGDGRRVYAECAGDAADAPTALCWARSYVSLLHGLAGAPDAPMTAAPLLDTAERDRILYGLNPGRRPEIRHRGLAGPFEEQVARTPDAVALLDEQDTRVTYRELNIRAGRLARALLERGAGPGTRVGICLPRGIPLVVAIHAVVRTGAAYVPLDADLPDAQLAYRLADAAPGHVLADETSRDRLGAGPWQFVDVAAEPAEPGGRAVEFPATADGLLHILYTSGTTGRPKGVAYPVAGALAHLEWMQSRYPFAAGDCAVFKTSPGFDVSIWELFWPLYHGACLVICAPGGHRDPRHLARLVERHPVSAIFLPPTVMAPFLEQVTAERAGRLRWALCGGEPVTARIRDTFHTRLPAAALVNCYGPTEAGNVTDMPLPAQSGAPVPLGRPAANFRLAVLDETLEPVPVGLAGEAYVAADIGLAHGYWRAPAATAERFVADPHGSPGARMYRTGDLCRYRDDGVLDHLGRIDRQVKIGGLRVEPGEIESVLVAHPAIADCAVLVHGDPARLYAFVVPAGGSPDEVDPAAIGDHAARLLPAHLRPARIVPVPGIPATVNGKVDRSALLATLPSSDDREIVPPADELEAALVDIYRRVLDTGPVSVLDSFARLGGQSVLAFRLLDECLATLREKPDATEVLTGTIREVAASIRTRR
ncbi:amino acid adenylation domain-containing protein [Nocardia sp. alder85J]|uniref:amino acid adenylation domain-containing protein n=1 Tax=Nocardia sp. alder85J TaxID=2862949 RepID=UPI001CD3E1D3|nr:amino acid adenylation domain-containing protein [Nocardia sp. alder85J]MCX4091613.1 amino acid adenylation domain-containing protein [Nocardia sp. alder85J]